MVGRLGINNFQVIVFNYITCVITGTIVNGSYPLTTTLVSQPWFAWSMLMGTVFIGLFNLIALTAQRNGVAVASVANKLSLVIPFIFSLYLYDETSTSLKVIGVFIAIFRIHTYLFSESFSPDLKRHINQLDCLTITFPLVYWRVCWIP